MRRTVSRTARRLGAVLASTALFTGLLDGALGQAPEAHAAVSVPSWVIPLYYEDEGTQVTRVCTGIVLSKSKTLAAPDCFTGMGEADMVWEYNSSGELWGGSNYPGYRTHPQFNATTRQAALAVTNRRTPDNAGKPVLASSADSALYAPGATAVFSSWTGLVEDQRYKHSEQVVIKSAAECAALLGSPLPSGMLCSAPAPGAPPVADDDQCLGDAGGALVAGGKLIGISATRSTGCVQSGVRLYARASSHRAVIGNWTTDVDLGVGDLGSFLGRQSYDLVDICAPFPGSNLGCKPDNEGNFSARGYNSVVQAGDLNGDGFGDLLARTSGGTLYRVPASDFEPDFDRRSNIGTGWQIYDRLVATRDLSGDGIPDVVARDKAGVLWLHRGTGKGGFVGRLRIGSGWNTYTALAGRGDLSGDGIPDLVARDKAGVLWFYRGTGKSTFAARTRVGSGWGQFNAIIGSGDFDRNGIQDLVTRTPAGALYVYNANHKGSFVTPPKKLATTYMKGFISLS
ncbi:trypsin-like serine protease [Streptomyces sp. YC504]|uniref:Trypsin-like serine protease n=1 Tax=Streptomyces mesophilus TaxID=1775132 RepID=A0A6G4XEU4_9ACTN|nr:FG-GAP-like repeat-containing protein [Streptomyces mesophilus]NGO76086.1 trypsin-like serine protease [Streptomyces mesophilus]